jgi:glycosyltransferase involved in cell wall biosynthesis
MNLVGKKKKSIIAIIINYNHGKYLKKNIKSFLNQTLLPDKILIIDDGSIDNSSFIIKQLKKKFKIINIKIFKKNLGVITRLNQVIKLINHSHFCFLGADDFLIDKDAIKNAMNAFSKNSDAAIASSLTLLTDEKYLIKKKFKSPIIANKITFFNNKEAIDVFKKFGWWINSHPIIVRSDLFFKEKLKFTNIGRYTDILVFYQLAFKYGCIFIPRYTGVYRIVNNQFGQKKNQSENNNFNQFVKALKKIKIIKNDKSFFKTIFLMRKISNFNNSYTRFFYLLIFNPIFLFYYFWSRLRKI